MVVSFLLSAMLAAAAPSEPVSTGHIAADAFAIQVGIPNIDPFPDAKADVAGWGLWTSPDNVRVHLLILDAAHRENARTAMAKRLVSEPALPATARLIFEAEFRDEDGARQLTSAVVERAPLATQSDVEKCELTETPVVVLRADSEPTDAPPKPHLKLWLKPKAAEKLKALVKRAPANERLYLTFGDEAPAWLFVGSAGRVPLEADLQVNGTERFQRLCNKP